MSRGEPYRNDPEVPPTLSTHHHARSVLSRERAESCVKLAAQALSLRQIGAKLGISKSQVSKLLKSELERPAESVGVLRGVENEKLDARERRANRIITLHEKELLQPGTSLDRRERCARVIQSQQQELYRVTEQRAKINGTYAPTKHQLTGADDGPLAVEVVTEAQLLAKLAKLAGEDVAATEPPPTQDDGDDTKDDDIPEGAESHEPIEDTADDDTHEQDALIGIELGSEDADEGDE